MKMVFWILSLVLTAQPAVALVQISGPGTSQQSVSRPAAKSPSPSVKPVSVMSIGKIEMIDFEAKRMQINGAAYAFDSTTRFFDGAAHRTQATRLKAGDRIYFWIKSGSFHGAPSLEQVTLLGKS